jgi:hypothetical protein
VNALVVMLVGAAVTYVTRTQTRDLKDDIRELRHEMREIRAELRSELASIRSDLTQIALAVGARPRPQTG